MFAKMAKSTTVTVLKFPQKLFFALLSALLAAASDGEALTEVTPQFPHAANGSVGGATLA